MNRMADRIPVRYAMLLSLFVMVVGLVWYAPAPAAATTTDPTVLTSTSPTSAATPTPSSTPTSTTAPTGSAATAGPTQTQDSSTSTPMLEPAPGSTTPGTTPSADKETETAPSSPTPVVTSPPGTKPSDGGGTDGSTDGSGGTNDGGQTTDPPDGGTGGGTNDGGTSDGGTSTGGTGGGTGTGGGSGTGGTTPTTPAQPVPAPSGSADPNIPTVEVPPGTGIPAPSQSPKPAPDADSGPTTPAAPATPDNVTPGTPAPKVEKIVLVPGDSKTPSVPAGSEVSAELDGVDGDGKYRVVSGELPPGLMLDAKTGKITGTAQRVGTYSFTIEYASEHQSAIQNYTLKVAERPTHIETPPLEPARAGEPYKPVVLRTEGGTGPFTYELKGSELSGTEEATTPLKTAPWVSGASHPAADVLRGSSKLQDAGPMVKSVADSEGSSDVELSGSRVGNLPAGMRLEGGVLAGKPKPEAAGTYTFTVISTDRYGSTAEQEMTITVLSEGDAVPITAGENANITSPAQLSEEIPGQAASAETETGSAMLPLMFGLLLLGAGTATVALRHRRTIGTHR